MDRKLLYFPCTHGLVRVFLAGMVLLVYGFYARVSAQAVYDYIGDVPAALKAEAPMPKDLAEKMEKMNEGKRKRFVRPGATLPNAHPAIIGSYKKYIRPEMNRFDMQIREGEIAVLPPRLKIINTSHTLERVVKDKKPIKFNPKKDRMSYAVLQDNRIVLVNHAQKACKMEEFLFETDSKALQMTGNQITILPSALKIASGQFGITQLITCTHIPSQTRYVFEIGFDWPRVKESRGVNAAYCFDVLPSDSFPRLGLLWNMDKRSVEVIQFPFMVVGDGVDGKNGRNGTNGMDGSNKYTYKDKKGNVRVINGTCGTAGGNGEDGGNGGNGGKFLMCVSDSLMQQYGMSAVSVTVDAGKAGKGGAGGRGGRHGTGSFCGSGRAADGRDGKDGKDGHDGDFVYIVTHVHELHQKTLKQ